jgi:hypothetical protein
MKIIITENQYELLKEMEDKPKVYNFPSLEIFGNEDPMDNWNLMQKFLSKKGNPDYTVDGDLGLIGVPIESLGNLKSVGGDLFLSYSKIKSLGNITSVGGNLYLTYSKIESLGNLTSVGGYLDLRYTPISKKYTEEEIRSQVKVEGDIYL